MGRDGADYNDVLGNGTADSMRIRAETLPLPYQSLDLDGRILRVNYKWLELLGYEQEAVVGRWFGDLLPAESQNLFEKRFAEFVATGRMENTELRMLRKDGARISVVFNGVAEYDAEERLTRTHCLIHDITELRTMELALRETREIAEQMLAAANAMVVGLDPVGNITLFNRYAEQLTGYAAEEILGDNWFERFRDGLIPEAFAAAVSGPPHVSANAATIRTKTGETRYINWRNAGLDDGRGGVSGILSIGIDVTEQRRAEEERRVLSEVVRYSGELVSLASLDGSMVFLNAAGARMLGIDPAKLASVNIMDVIPEPWVDRVQRDLIPALARGETWEGELQYKNLQTGSITDVNVMAFTIKDPDTGEPQLLANVSRDVTEPRRIVSALGESEEKLRITFETIAEGVVITDLHVTVLQANREALRMFGFEHPEDAIGRSVTEFVADSDLDLALQEVGKAMEEGRAGPTELALLRADGTRFPCEVTGSLMRDAEGKAMGFVVTARDVTERKRAEDGLRASEARQRAILEAMPDLMFVLDRDGRYVDYHATHDDQLYARPSEFVGRAIGEILPADSAAKYMKSIQAVLQSGEVSVFEYSLPFEGEGDRYFEARMTRSTEERVLCVAREITERKLAEAALRVSEERFRGMYENAAVGIAIRDLGEGGSKYDVNPTFAEMLGYTAAELSGMNIRQLASADDIAEDAARLEEMLAAERGAFISEIRLTRKDGDTVWARVTTSAVRSARGSPLQVIRILEDITERKTAETELRSHAERLRDLRTQLDQATEEERRRIARELHDQVSQNLTALSLSLQLAGAKLPATAEDVQRRFDDAVALVGETAQQIRDLTFDLRPPVLDDFGLIAAAQWHAERISTQSDLEVVIEGAEPDPRLHPEHAIALFRIIQEAITNVLKHASACRISICVDSRDDLVRVVIRDDGRGFDSTRQTSASAGRTPVGLGLINMRERAQAIGGTLSVESGEGKGTVIVVELAR